MVYDEWDQGRFKKRSGLLRQVEDRLLTSARQTSERVLVTGNARHFPASVRGPVTVLTPREAWERLNARV